MEQFKSKEMQTVIEYILLGVTISLGYSLKDDGQVDDFFDCVKDRCVWQGLDEQDVLNTLSSLKDGVMTGVKDKAEGKWK